MPGISLNRMAIDGIYPLVRILHKNQYQSIHLKEGNTDDLANISPSERLESVDGFEKGGTLNWSSVNCKCSISLGMSASEDAWLFSHNIISGCAQW